MSPLVIVGAVALAQTLLLLLLGYSLGRRMRDRDKDGPE